MDNYFKLTIYPTEHHPEDRLYFFSSASATSRAEAWRLAQHDAQQLGRRDAAFSVYRRTPGVPLGVPEVGEVFDQEIAA